MRCWVLFYDPAKSVTIPFRPTIFLRIVSLYTQGMSYKTDFKMLFMTVKGNIYLKYYFFFLFCPSFLQY